MLLDTLVSRRIPVTPVNTIDDLLADPQVKERGSLVQVAHPALGDLALAAPAPLLRRTPGKIGEVDPPLGADIVPILEQWRR
jgi:crotonobetainyl-CoA:carnitine CoA-transferase CaiB-like acyl-CoA transferase